ncbi:MAG TPA: hypothetical protein VNO50_03605 [Pyrinomonadaceae bacterium]|nr:hypothetical protein [Pyrinomonadaceae bacterium]
MKHKPVLDEQIFEAEVKVLLGEQIADQILLSQLKTLLHEKGYQQFESLTLPNRFRRNALRRAVRRRLSLMQEKPLLNEFSRDSWRAQWIARFRFAKRDVPSRPPLNAEYILYLFLGKEERDEVIGDLIESYGHVLRRFSKRHADIWFYKQVVGSVLPLFRRTLLKVGALVWLGRVLRRLIS